MQAFQQLLEEPDAPAAFITKATEDYAAYLELYKKSLLYRIQKLLLPVSEEGRQILFDFLPKTNELKEAFNQISWTWQESDVDAMLLLLEKEMQSIQTKWILEMERLQ